MRGDMETHKKLVLEWIKNKDWRNDAPILIGIG
jgi:hypothetical protein